MAVVFVDDEYFSQTFLSLPQVPPAIKRKTNWKKASKWELSLRYNLSIKERHSLGFEEDTDN
jgi:hypothetical protein